MILKIDHITVNTPEREYEYHMDIPDWRIHTVLAEIGKSHPSTTSIVVIFTRANGD